MTGGNIMLGKIVCPKCNSGNVSLDENTVEYLCWDCNNTFMIKKYVKPMPKIKYTQLTMKDCIW